jgi:hypothetical protein
MTPHDRQFKTGAELLAVLQSEKYAEIECWSLHLDEHGIWMTNPYGNTCGLKQDPTVEACESILETIRAAICAEEDDEKEWA